MEQNPLRDLAEQAKQQSLELKLKSIQDDLATVRNDMQALMGEIEQINTICTQLRRDIFGIEDYIRTHQNIDDPKLPPTYVK